MPEWAEGNKLHIHYMVSSYNNTAQHNIVLRTAITQLSIILYCIQHYNDHVHGLVQNCSISSASAMEILKCCTKPSMWKQGSNWTHLRRPYLALKGELWGFCEYFREFYTVGTETRIFWENWLNTTPWLLIPWRLASLGHQQPWYWLCRINRSLSSMRKDFNCLCHDAAFCCVNWCHKKIYLFCFLQNRWFGARKT